MLSARQIWVCSALAVLFWVVATLAVHVSPGSITGPISGPAAFVISIPVGWLCVRLTRRAARLDASQIAAACLLVVAVATCIDGGALRYLPGLYAADERTCRLAAAWLLWGYGVSGFAALVMSAQDGAGPPPRRGWI